MQSNVKVIIEQDEDGYYAYVPEWEGCHTQGETLDEVMANMREAIALYSELEWPIEFWERTYGCTADAPLIRPSQGTYEPREAWA